jgi:hypothetical protein
VAAGAGAAEGGVREGGSLWGDGHGDWAMAWAGCGKDIYIYIYIEYTDMYKDSHWNVGNIGKLRWEQMGEIGSWDDRMGFTVHLSLIWFDDLRGWDGKPQ